MPEWKSFTFGEDGEAVPEAMPAPAAPSPVWPSSVLPSTPVWAASYGPFLPVTSAFPFAGAGCSSAPSVPATPCGGHVSTKSGFSEKCAPGSICQSCVVAISWYSPRWAST